MAPTSDIRNPAASFGPYHPSARPIDPPTIAPAMPSNIVTIQPPGSRPGISSLAIAPATKPKMIHDRIPISCPLFSFGSHTFGCSLAQVLLIKNPPQAAVDG